MSTAVNNILRLGYITTEINRATNYRKIFVVGLEPNSNADNPIEITRLPYRERPISLSSKLEDNTISKIKEDNNTTTNTGGSSPTYPVSNFSNLSKTTFIDQELQKYNLDKVILENVKQYCLDNMKGNAPSYIKGCVEGK